MGNRLKSVTEKCEWGYDLLSGMWEKSCGDPYTGKPGPSRGGFKSCPYCSREIVEVDLDVMFDKLQLEARVEE